MGLPWTQQFDWTDERVGTLRSLFDQKHTADYIAKQLGGLTRNAVIGKLHRLGLRREGRIRKVRPHVVERKAPFKVKSRVPLPPMARPKLEDIVCAPVPLLELPFSGACKFEVSGLEKASEYRFCANATKGDCVYCPDHMAIAHNRTRGGHFSDDQPDGRTYNLRKRSQSREVAGVASVDLRELE